MTPSPSEQKPNTCQSADVLDLPASEVEVAVLSVADSLLASLRRVVSELPGGPYRPQEFARELSVNKNLASRLFGALRKHDSLAAIHAIPGPVPLRQMLQAAEERGVDRSVIEEAERNVSSFDRLLRTEVGGRNGLDALLSASLPDARESLETTAKQAVFRGFVGLKGISVDTIFVAFVVGPMHGETRRCDTLVVNASYGLRRLRPGAHFEFLTILRSREGREAIGADAQIVESFCSPSPSPLTARRRADRVRYVLDDEMVGYANPADLVTSEFYRTIHPAFAEDSDTPKRWFYAITDQPAKLLVFDMFVHAAVWTKSDPELVVFDTLGFGPADPHDHEHNQDRLERTERVEPLIERAGMYRCADVPRYTELLGSLTNEHGWNLADFRGYRTRISYPVYGSQICMLFEPPSQG